MCVSRERESFIPVMLITLIMIMTTAIKIIMMLTNVDNSN